MDKVSSAFVKDRIRAEKRTNWASLRREARGKHIDVSRLIGLLPADDPRFFVLGQVGNYIRTISPHHGGLTTSDKIKKFFLG